MRATTLAVSTATGEIRMTPTASNAVQPPRFVPNDDAPVPLPGATVILALAGAAIVARGRARR